MSRALVAAVVLVTAARAEAQDGREAQALRVAEAERADSECRPADALVAWRAAETAAPGSRLARRASLRRAELEARDVAAFAPLAALCEHRRDAMQIDRAGWLAYARELDATPPGLVRREGRAVVAEALGRLRAEADARAAWAALLREPGVTAAERRHAAEETAYVDERAGRLADGARVLRDAGLGSTPSMRRIAREQQRRVGRIVAWAFLAAFLVAAATVLGRRASRVALRRAVTPGRALLAGWALAVPLALASLYDHEALDTFATFAASGGAVLLVAALVGAVSPRARGPRVALAVASSLAVLAAGYLVLDRSGVLIDIGL